MGVSPRALAIRLVLWSLLFISAVYQLRKFEASQIFVAPPPPTAVSVFDAPGQPRADAPDVVDPAAAMAALAEVTRAAGACGARGTLSVRLGAAGLEGATFLGALGDEACVRKAVGGGAWPAGRTGFEVEGSVGK